MKNEIPPSTTIAPMAMMMAELPDRPLAPPLVELVTVGVAVVVVVGVETEGCGKPGESGLLWVWRGLTGGVVLWAPAKAGNARPSSAAETAIAVRAAATRAAVVRASIRTRDIRDIALMLSIPMLGDQAPHRAAD